MRLFAPVIVVREPVRGEAGRNHGLDLHGLLIKARALSAAMIKTVRANRNEVLGLFAAALQVRKPPQAFKTDLCHFRVRK